MFITPFQTTGRFEVPTDGIYLIATRISTGFRNEAEGTAIFYIKRLSASSSRPVTIARAETLSVRQDPDAVMATAIVKLDRKVCLRY